MRATPHAERGRAADRAVACAAFEITPGDCGAASNEGRGATGGADACLKGEQQMTTVN